MTRRKAFARSSVLPPKPPSDLLVPAGFEAKGAIKIDLPPELLEMQRLAELQADINRRVARRHWITQELRLMFMQVSDLVRMDGLFAPYSAHLLR